jgi:hypothetical protein
MRAHSMQPLIRGVGAGAWGFWWVKLVNVGIAEAPPQQKKNTWMNLADDGFFYIPFSFSAAWVSSIFFLTASYGEWGLIAKLSSAKIRPKKNKPSTGGKY